MSTPARRVREKLFNGVEVPGNVGDSYMLLVLKLVDVIDPTPSSTNDAQSVVNYLFARDGNSLAVQDLAARFNTMIEADKRR